jgi:hypothetical protein
MTAALTLTAQDTGLTQDEALLFIIQARRQ